MGDNYVSRFSPCAKGEVIGLRLGGVARTGTKKEKCSIDVISAPQSGHIQVTPKRRQGSHVLAQTAD